MIKNHLDMRTMRYNLRQKQIHMQ